MANENKTEQEDFLGDLKDDQSGNPFEPNKDDPFASTEEKGTEAVVTDDKEEKQLPFHKDPKVQRYIERQIAKRIPEQKTEETPDNYFDDVVQAFTQIVGNDTPEKTRALDALKNSLTTLEQRTLERAIERQELQRQEEVEVEQEYDNKLNDGFESIEEETGIDLYAPQNKKLRVKFIEFVEQVAPKEDGEISELPDIGATFKAFQNIYKPQSQTNRAKQLASQNMGNTGGEIIPKTDTSRLTFDNVGDKIREALGM